MGKITNQLGAVWTWSADDDCYVYNGYKCHFEDGTLITMHMMDQLEEEGAYA